MTNKKFNPRTRSFHTIVSDFGYEKVQRGMLPFTYKAVENYSNLMKPMSKTQVEVSISNYEYKNHAADAKLKRAKELVEAENMSFPDLWKLVKRYKDMYCAYPVRSEEGYLSAVGDLWHLRTQIRIGLKGKEQLLIDKLEAVISTSSPDSICKYIDVYLDFLPKEDYEKTEEKLNLQEMKSFRREQIRLDKVNKE